MNNAAWRDFSSPRQAGGIRLSSGQESMFHRILFPTDFSDHARRALDCITGFPSVTDVILLHVTQSTRFSSGSIAAEGEEPYRDLLRKDQSSLSHLGLRVSICLEQTSGGSLHETILSVAERKRADLIAISGEVPKAGSGLLFGSLVSSLIRTSTRNLYLIRNRVIEDLNGERYERYCPMVFSRILFPVDLTPLSLGPVLALSEMPGVGEMILIHVVPWGEEKEALDSRVAQGFIVIEQFCSELKKKGIRASGNVLIGDPAQTISRYAEEEDVSVICLTPSGKGRIREILSGSFTFTLAGITRRPVLILKDLPDAAD